MQKLSVLMPVFNESRTLRTIIQRVLESPIDLDVEVVAVDDCSQDDSLRILHELAATDSRIRVFSQPVNRGKGAAIRRAIEEMTGDVAIVQDSDLEYDPRQYPQVLKPIVEGKADAVYGSRFAASPERRVLLFWHSLGNKLLTALSNMANDLNLTDMETCYKAVRTDILRSLRLTSDRFGIEPEITARLAQWGARIYEVPISYHGRSYAEGKNIGWRDGLQALWLIFKFRFVDTRVTEEADAATRQSLGRARAFRRWVLDQFEGFIAGSVLEVEAGPGTYTEFLLDSESLVATDSNASSVETLRRRYGHLENTGFAHWRPGEEILEAGPFDTAVCLAGLQRSDDPKAYLAAIAENVRSGGHILIQVPSDPRLTGATDAAVGHRRRFDMGDLEEMISAVGLASVTVRPFNLLGRIGWRVNHALGRDRIGFSEAWLFGMAIPVARLVDGWSGPDSGLSLVAVARKS